MAPAPTSSDSAHSDPHLRRLPRPWLLPGAPSPSHPTAPQGCAPPARTHPHCFPLLPRPHVRYSRQPGEDCRRHQCGPRLLDLPGLSAAAKGTSTQSSANGINHALSDPPTTSFLLLLPVPSTCWCLPERELVFFRSGSCDPDWTSPEFPVQVPDTAHCHLSN